MHRFSVSFAYPVRFTHNVFACGNPVLEQVICRLKEPRRQRVMFFFDRGLAEAQPERIPECLAYVASHTATLDAVCPPLLVPGGERAKSSWDAALAVMEALAAQHLCRQSVVVAVGGGSMLDIVGFAASLVHRGLRLVRVPSTTLGQCDSGVGVKTGIDVYGGKNALGTFAPPFAVLNDADLLRTLPDRYWRGGLAEAWKVAIIQDASLFSFLCEQAETLADRDLPTTEEVLRRAAELHLRHIRQGGDPFEFGSARPLDFGHWCAHALERLSNYDLSHGEAVSIGMALDCCHAVELGLFPPEAARQTIEGLRRTGLPLWSPWLEHRDTEDKLSILAGLEAFREHLGGELTLTLPTAIGAAIEVHALAPDLVARGIERLRLLSA